MFLPNKPEQEKQGRGSLLGFFDRAITPNQRTGMSPLTAAAAGLDALILPEMRMGDAIRQQGAQRAKSMAANRTAETLRAQGREDLAKLLLDGGINAQQAISMMQSDKAADLAFKRQKQLKQMGTGLGGNSEFAQKFRIYKSANPDMPDAEILQLLQAEDKSNLPATFRSLDLTARAAGFLPKSEGGTGKYEEFMSGQGAGFKQVAKNMANLTTEKLEQYGASIQKAGRATELINRIKTSPSLDGVLGKVEGQLKPGTPGGFLLLNAAETDLVQLIDNLENSVFLSAFQDLKGGGQITELEGEKAQRAIVNLSRVRSRKDFLEALQDYQDVINAGAERAAKGLTVDNPYTGTISFSGFSNLPSPTQGASSPTATPQPTVINGYTIQPKS
jgi:hypothetical protein